MFSNHELRSRIEDAWHVQPTCTQCGQPTTLAVRGDALWVECPTRDQPRSRLERLLRIDFSSLHTRRSVADLGAAA